MKRRVFVTMCLLAGFMMPWSGTNVFAQALSRADAQAIHDVIQSQLDAFAADDAVKAFELAAPSTQASLGDSEKFLQLIKEKYPPIYRHRVAIFQDPEIVDGSAHQVVRLTDRDNLVWVAVYRMQQEPDGEWKIEGCKLLETTSVSV